MTDPTVRIWLIFLVIYGTHSVKVFLNYTQNDHAGVAFKAPRVVRSRIAYLELLADDDKDPLQHLDFAPLLDFVEARSALYVDLDPSAIVRQAALTAVYYFQGVKGAESKPREQRGLRWLRHPGLLVLGLMDEKGHAVQTAQELVAMATQGVKGIAQSMLPFMPDGLQQRELEAAIMSATDGPCVAFQPDHLRMIASLARQSVASVNLADLVGAQPLRSLLLRVGVYVPVGNFVAETVVKTLTHDLHPTQRRNQAYATMLAAARHRTQLWRMSDADYAWASRQLGHSSASRRVEKRDLKLQCSASTSTPRRWTSLTCYHHSTSRRRRSQMMEMTRATAPMMISEP